VLAVSGAKGGVGKTLFAANLALYLATIGRRVLLVDADAGGANAHTMLGVDRPRGTGLPPEFGPVVDTPVPNLRLMRAGLDRPATGGSRSVRRSRLLERLRTAEGDHEFVVVDLGAGTESTIVDFYLGADLGVFVTLPEPTAVENTYRFLRAAFARRLRGAAPTREDRLSLLSSMAELGGTPPPVDLLERLAARGDPLAPLVEAEMGRFVPRLVLNQTRVRADLELGDAMRSVTYRRFGLELDYLGHIDFDDTVWSCVRSRRPLLVESPGTKASKSIEKISRRLLAVDGAKARARPLRTAPRGTHHDLLEVDRGATDEEIRRAYKRAKEVYDPAGIACYGSFDAAEIERLRVRLQEAHDVLLDPARRKPYELSVFSEPAAPEQVAVDEDAAAPLPPAPEITPDTELTGAVLRAVRESMGLDLRDISARTKIGVPYLRAIEADDFASLPALVYVRGFVSEVAKVLRLDREQASRTYVRRYRRFLEERGAKN
jgi:flagellar biosynthesis protein FlhG